MLSLARLSDAVATTPALTKWLQGCPDPDAMNQAIQRFMGQIQHEKWLSEEISCPECGEKQLREEMRWDDSGLFGADTYLICRHCWNCTNEAQLGGLGPWPEELPSMIEQDNTEAELPILWEGQIIGYVQRYSRKTHSGRVTLDKFPHDTEYGLLKPEWQVARPDEVE